MTLELPRLANGQASLTDRKHGASMQWSLTGASEVAGERSGTLVVYRGALDGADVVLRPMRQGVEDFITFTSRPRLEQVTYQLSLGEGVAGLRVVDGVVELVDAEGTPRLRAGRARIVDASGRWHTGEVELSGCAADRSFRAAVGPTGDNAGRARVHGDLPLEFRGLVLLSSRVRSAVHLDDDDGSNSSQS